MAGFTFCLHVYPFLVQTSANFVHISERMILMEQKLIINTVKLSILKDAMSPHFNHTEFLQRIFPTVFDEEDEKGILHFIFPHDDKQDSRAKTNFMNGNIKSVKIGNEQKLRRDYVKALQLIAFIIQRNNTMLKWADFLKENYPYLEYETIRSIADMDLELYPKRFKNVIETENNTYYLLIFMICWSIFGERVEMCNFKSSTQYTKTDDSLDISDDEKFFHAILSNPKDIECIDFAYHSGYKWCYDTKRTKLLTNFFASGGKLRVIVNSPSAAEKIGKHTRNTSRSYVGFKASIQAWKKLLSKNPGSVELVVSDIPLLHSYANFRFKNSKNSKMLVIFYTYANPVIADDHHLHLTPESKEYTIFEQEFEYLMVTGVNKTYTPTKSK